MNSIDYWKPLFLKLLFDSNFDENSKADLFNTSMSNMELLQCVGQVEKERVPYQPIIEDISMDDEVLVKAVDKIEEE